MPSCAKEKVARIGIWDFKGEKATLHGHGEANVWQTNVC